jgi:hypothetical protein
VYRPSSFGIGADPGHHEHRRPSTNVPTEASGWRSTVRKSIARLGAAPWTEDIQPRRSGDQRSPNGGRPQHVAAGGEASVPAIDDELCLKARSAVRLQLGGTGFDVEPLRPDAHGASITGSVSEVDPAGRPRLDTAR